MDLLPLDPDELLTTTRAVRLRLDLDRPVDRSVVEDCLRIAFQAPNGSNRQTWTWVVVDDPDVRRRMADIWRAGMDDLTRAPADSPSDAASPSPAERAEAIAESVAHLRRHLDEIPLLVVPVVSGRPEGASMFTQATMWGSILPAVWSFMLALRARGLGSVWTTVHLERELEMAELLGIPHERVTQAGLFPVAWTIGTDFRPGRRETSADSVRWNHW